MAKKFVSGSFDCTQLVKDLFIKGKKKGGIYCNFIAIEKRDSEDEFLMIQDLSEEDKEYNKAVMANPDHKNEDLKRGPIIGNFRIKYSNNQISEEDKKDIPF